MAIPGRLPALLSIHAVDNTGEEGILADAAVSQELGCRHAGVVTSILVARGGSAEALEALSLSLVAQQFEASMSEFRPTVARTGILCGARQVELTAGLLTDSGVADVVVSPVLRIGTTRILDEPTLDAIRRKLFPLARVLVLRAADAQTLTGGKIEDLDGVKRAAQALREQGARAVLIAGVISRGRVLDLLDDQGHVGLFDASRVSAPRIPGLSGAHAAALACHLARGQSLPRAIDAAQRYIAFRLQRGS